MSYTCFSCLCDWSIFLYILGLFRDTLLRRALRHRWLFPVAAPSIISTTLLNRWSGMYRKHLGMRYGGYGTGTSLENQLKYCKHLKLFGNNFQTRRAPACGQHAPDFLKLFLWGCLYMCIYVHVCVSALRLKIINDVIWTTYVWLNKILQPLSFILQL